MINLLQFERTSSMQKMLGYFNWEQPTNLGIPATVFEITNTLTINLSSISKQDTMTTSGKVQISSHF